MKIGIARYPYFQHSLKGGDYVLFDQITQALASHYIIEEIYYDRPFEAIIRQLPDLIRKGLVWLIDLFVAPLFTFQLLRNHSAVDLVLADSAVITYLPWFKFFNFEKKPFVIPVINIDYHAYSQVVLNSRPIRSRFTLKLLQYWQRRGAKQFPGVAVSEFVATTYKEKGLPLLTVIENAVAEIPMISTTEQACKGRCVYAGSSDYHGKGIDELEKLAAMGIEIHTFTPSPFNGLIHHAPLSRNMLLNSLQCFDLLIFPSRYESFGMIAIEAMAIGLPIIMRPTGIGLQLQKEVPECIIEDNDWAKQCFHRILYISSNRAYFSQKVQKFASQYLDMKLFNSRWRDLMESILSSIESKSEKHK